MRERISNQKREHIQQFWLQNTEEDPYYTKLNPGQRNKNIPSEKKEFSPIRWLSISESKLYDRYRSECFYQNHTPVGKQTFLKLKPFNIRRRKFVNGLCSICISHYFALAQDRNHRSTTEYIQHKEIKDHQFQKFKSVVQNLQGNEMLIVLDFGSIVPIPLTRNEMTNDWWNKDGVNDLIFVIFKKENQKIIQFFAHGVALSRNKKKHSSDDNTNLIPSLSFNDASESESRRVFHGHVYVRLVFQHLFEETELFNGVSRLILWSDGGPAHFKIRRTLFMMKEFSTKYQILIEWHFFASNHGKGPCDGKHGVDKRKLRERALEGNPIQTLDDYIAVISKVKNTRIVFKVEGAESNSGHDYAKFTKGIKRFHEYIFNPGAPEIRCREKSGDGEIISQKVERVESPVTAKESDHNDMEGCCEDLIDSIDGVEKELEDFFVECQIHQEEQQEDSIDLLFDVEDMLDDDKIYQSICELLKNVENGYDEENDINDLLNIQSSK
jgi:hypothetical protein